MEWVDVWSEAGSKRVIKCLGRLVAMSWSRLCRSSEAVASLGWVVMIGSQRGWLWLMKWEAAWKCELSMNVYLFAGCMFVRGEEVLLLRSFL